MTREYSVDALARAGRSTVRNVRAYQDRGLLPPPQRRGRSGVYTEEHLARLRVIQGLLERGYTIANIGELLAAWEKGHDLRQLLGLETAIASPWSDEAPLTLTLEDLAERFGPNLKPKSLSRAMQLELIVAEGEHFRVPSPRLLAAGAELVKAGIPMEELLDIIELMRGNVEKVANALVRLIVEYVFDPLGKDQLPPAKEVPRLAEIVWRLRPLATMAVSAEVDRGMEKAAERFLGDRLDAILQRMRSKKPRR